MPVDLKVLSYSYLEYASQAKTPPEDVKKDISTRSRQEEKQISNFPNGNTCHLLSLPNEIFAGEIASRLPANALHALCLSGRGVYPRLQELWMKEVAGEVRGRFGAPWSQRQTMSDKKWHIPERQIRMNRAVEQDLCPEEAKEGAPQEEPSRKVRVRRFISNAMLFKKARQTEETPELPASAAPLVIPEGLPELCLEKPLSQEAVVRLVDALKRNESVESVILTQVDGKTLNVLDQAMNDGDKKLESLTLRFETWPNASAEMEQALLSLLKKMTPTKLMLRIKEKPESGVVSELEAVLQEEVVNKKTGPSLFNISIPGHSVFLSGQPLPYTPKLLRWPD